mgnify:CR=1 FL=1
MPSLLDIAPSTATVAVRGVALDVPGIGASGLASLMRRFPAIHDLLTGKGLSLDADALLSTGPEAVAAIIAAGCGNPGDAAHEAAADALPIGDQIEVLAKILEVTLPDGPKNIEARLVGMLRRVGLSQTPLPSQSDTSQQTDSPAPSA